MWGALFWGVGFCFVIFSCAKKEERETEKHTRVCPHQRAVRAEGESNQCCRCQAHAPHGNARTLFRFVRSRGCSATFLSSLPPLPLQCLQPCAFAAAPLPPVAVAAGGRCVGAPSRRCVASALFAQNPSPARAPMAALPGPRAAFWPSHACLGSRRPRCPGVGAGGKLGSGRGAGADSRASFDVGTADDPPLLPPRFWTHPSW